MGDECPDLTHSQLRTRIEGIVEFEEVLFAGLGALVADARDLRAEVSVELAVLARHHGWQADLLGGLVAEPQPMPRPDGGSSDRWTVASADERRLLTGAFESVGRAGPGGAGALLLMQRCVIPRLMSLVARTREAISALADAPARRMLQIVHDDLARDLARLDRVVADLGIGSSTAVQDELDPWRAPLELVTSLEAALLDIGGLLSGPFESS
ncbi:MAG: hypothetical protein R2698_05100 [Microthrixaceae bacterium]